MCSTAHIFFASIFQREFRMLVQDVLKKIPVLSFRMLKFDRYLKVKPDCRNSVPIPNHVLQIKLLVPPVPAIAESKEIAWADTAIHQNFHLVQIIRMIERL